MWLHANIDCKVGLGTIDGLSVKFPERGLGMAAKRFQADSAAARFTFMNGRFFAPSLMARFRAILLVHAAATAINLD